MNREQRRKFNKQNKTNFSLEEFKTLELLYKMKYGKNLSTEDIKDLSSEERHVDMFNLAPEGALVKINYEAICQRPQKQFTEMYKEWIEGHKDNEFHLTREESKNSLVCLQEDVNEMKELKAQTGEARDPWLFDIFTDLLFFDEKSKEWTTL